MSFSTIELNRLNDFLLSPYHNKDQRVVKLLQALIKYALNEEVFDSLTQMKVYQTVFLDSSVTKTVLSKRETELLRVKMSVLLKLAQRFLTIEAIEENTAPESNLLHKKLLEKKQFRLLTRRITKIKKLLEGTKAKGIEEYRHNFILETNQLNVLAYQRLLIKEGNFLTLIANLDIIYLLQKLKLQAEMSSLIKLTNTKNYDFGPMNAIDKLLELPQYSREPLIFLYRTINELIETNKETTYFYLLELLEQYANIIPINDLAGFYTVACNFCTRQIRLGKLSYNKKLLTLYKIIEERNLLLDKDALQIVKLKNIVALSCKNSEFEWAAKIIDKYCPLLNKDIQESVFHFNMGGIEFYKGNYNEAISHLIRVETNNLTYDYNLDCKIILLKSHYQIDTLYDERTMRVFRSAEQFVQTNKLMPVTTKKSYKNFILILINLYRVRHNIGKRTLESIQNKLENMEFVSDKKWLLEQMVALEYKKGA